MIPGLAESGGLFVVDHSFTAVSDSVALDGAVHGKLDVLREKIKGPAAVFPDHASGYKEAGAGNVAVGSEKHPREIQKPGLPEEPDGISGGDPVAAEILGVAVAGQDIVFAGIEGLIHFGREIRVNQVVGVEDKVAVVVIAPVHAQMVEKIIQRIAFAALCLVLALIDSGAGLSGDPGRLICAVVRDDIDIQKPLRIILVFQVPDKFADDGLLIPCWNNGGEPMEAGRRVFLPGSSSVHQPDHQIDELVKVGGSQDDCNRQVKPLCKLNQFHNTHLL